MKNIKEMAANLSNQVQEWRHVFHAHPELSFYEVKTTERIVAILKDIGFTNIQVGIPHFPNTGVFVDLNPGKEGPCIALRGDIDALPIHELAEVPYKSKVDNVSHCCGHDAHTSMLLGVAKILFQMKDSINGNVRFVFQPGEEAFMPDDIMPELPRISGANLIANYSDILKGVDAIVALHVWGQMPSGLFGCRVGPTMATNSAGQLIIKGKGGHGAMPHTCVDPVVIAAQIISAWQTIVSRETDPLDVAVITVGSVVAQGAWNVVPHEATLEFGIRALSLEAKKNLFKRLDEMSSGIASAMNASTEFSVKDGAPPVVNDKQLTTQFISSIESMYGAESCFETKPIMASEDFAWYLPHMPGCLLFLGVGDETKDTNYAQHHPRFKVDDSVLHKGVAAMAQFAVDYINRNESSV